MNLKFRPFFLAAGIGLVIQVVITMGSVGASLFMMSTDYNTPAESTWVGISLAATGLACFCPLIIDLGVGGLYPFLHARLVPVTIGEGVLGGAAASALARVVNSLVGICLNTLIIPFAFRNQMPGEMPLEVMGIMMGSSLIGGIVGLAFALIIGSVLGMIGGLIGAALFGETSKLV